MTETPNPAATPDGADPSMEEILASIRRILNEEEAPAVPGPVVEAPVGDDVLVLDQSMMVSPTAPVIEAEPPAEVRMPAPGREPEPPAPIAEPPKQAIEVVVPARQPDMGGWPALTPDLVAPEAAAAAASSVGSLIRSLAAGRTTQLYSGGPTLEDMVRAELRPLMKEWLDANLPPLVERLVRAEIERVVGRAVP